MDGCLSIENDCTRCYNNIKLDGDNTRLLKRIIYVLLFFSLFNISIKNLKAQESIVLSIDETHIVEDYIFSVDIKTNLVENLVGFQFKINFNQAFVVENIDVGNELTSSSLSYNIDNENQSIIFVYADVNNPLSSEELSILNLEFRAPSVIENQKQQLLILDQTFHREFVFMSEDFQLSKTNNVSQNFLDLTKAMIGDVNLDGVITLIDVALIQLHVALLDTLEGISFRVADIDNDESLDIIDAAKIQLYIAELIDILE